MAFRFRCPKCNTTSFSIERDSRSYAPRGQTHELIFSCRCGKQLFGDQIEQEYMRQKSEWEAGASDRRRDRTAPPKAAPKPPPTFEDDDNEDVYARQRASRVKRALEEAAEEDARRQEEDKKWRERVANQPAAAQDAPPSDDHEDDEEDGESTSDTCEWKDCDNPPRPNSKYCSRDCSNKNARSRYKRRKGRGREAA